MKILFNTFVVICVAATITYATTSGVIQLPQTGQTTLYSDKDDGSLRKGVAWPNPRFTDSNNGTVTDILTGLVWLKNASCTDTVAGITPSSYDGLAWGDAVSWSANLVAGKCGLTDNSTVGQWRLPNITELESLVDISHYGPAISSPAPGLPFMGVKTYSFNYWSASSGAQNNLKAWTVDMTSGSVSGDYNKTSSLYVWPVRNGY